MLAAAERCVGGTREAVAAAIERRASLVSASG